MATLASAGLNQAVTLPFVNPDDVAGLGMAAEDLLTVKNPLSDEESKLRPTLLPGLLSAVKYNVSRGARRVALFEVGKVFFTTAAAEDPRLPEQVDRVAWCVHGDFGPQQFGEAALGASGGLSLGIWHRLADSLGVIDFRLEPASPPGYHPGRAAEVMVQGRSIGHVGELSPRASRHFEIDGRVGIAELDVASLVAAVPSVQSATPSPYPHVDFDLSFLMDRDDPIGPILSVTIEAGTPLVESAYVFDEFVTEELGGKKAVAIRYRLRAGDRTLTNEEVAPLRQSMIDSASDLGASLRGV